MYFVGMRTVADIKTEYRRLAKANHPDLGGDTATMQEINAQYHARLEALDGQEFAGFENKTYTYHYRYETEEAAMQKVLELLALQLPGVTIELIGTWVWAYGDPDPRATKPVKEELKAAGLIWHGKRKKWYWRRYPGAVYTGVPFGKLREVYGSRAFGHEEAEQEPALVAA